LQQCPGEHAFEEKVVVPNWHDVLVMLKRWLVAMKREFAVLERTGDLARTVPHWALAELPADYHELVKRIQ
jgi:hypothetical protein